MIYDANGNTLSDGMNSYSWDARNRLASADNNAASFSYDPLGRRTSKTTLSTTTGFLYDGVNAVQESGTNGTANLLAGGVDERFLRTDTSGTYAYLTDALGSTIALTDSTGTPQIEYSYSPYGSQSASGAITTNSYTYTGRENDGLGIDYYRARYYNPNTGRFLSRDPDDGKFWDPKTLHKYLYANGDPINQSDPSGRGAIFEYEFNIGNITYKIALHSAHHYWALPIIKTLWCVHLALYSITQGVGLNWSAQIPLPWCSAGGPF